MTPIVVLALAVGGVTVACSSSSGSGVSAACKTARTQFLAWLSSDHTAGTAENAATDAWVAYDKTTGSSLPSPSDAALTAAISKFNVDVQQAQAARQTANQDLARYQASVKSCTQSSLPKACQQEFAQHQPSIDGAASQDQAHNATVQAILAEQQAYRAQNASAANAATTSFNAAVDQFNAATTAWNASLDAFNGASARCKSALG